MSQNPFKFIPITHKEKEVMENDVKKVTTNISGPAPSNPRD